MKRTKQIQVAGAKPQSTGGLQPRSMPRLPTVWAGRIPRLKPARYADGLPIHQVEYLCCKLILRPNRFTSRQSLFDFAKVLREPAADFGVGLATKEFKDWPLKIREVLFIDTPGC